MQIKSVLKAGLVIVVMTSASVAFAHSGASGVVKTRMDVMSSIAKSMKAIGAMMKGEVVFDSSVVKSSAVAIAKHAKHIPHLFPKGSNEKPSEALPTVWTDWDRFAKLANSMEVSAQALAAAADGAVGTDDIRAELGAVGKTCKACHSDFRLKK